MNPSLLVASALAGPPAIVNGELAERHAWPETVTLVRGTEAFCTGTLIDPEWVLTAAHCVDDEKGPFDVGFGSDASALVDRIAAREVVVHPDYLFELLVHDVALVRLAERKFDVFPMPLNAEPVDDSWLDTPLTSVGFGITDPDRDDAGMKRHADVPIVGYTGDLVLTFDSQGRSTCRGDSGGPGVLQTADGYTQVTIASWGVACGQEPSAGTRVDAYLPWILAQGIDVRTTPASAPSFTCAHDVHDAEAVGVVPFDLDCAVTSSDLSEITSVEWHFGDGGTADGTTASHTYTEAGRYTVQMCAEGVSAGGPWRHCASEPGTVLACTRPTPAFTMAPSDRDPGPLTFDLVNRTPMDPYGCIQDLVWEIHAGDASGGEPLQTLHAGWSPRYTFDGHGVYTVVLHVGGYGGTASTSATLDTRLGTGVGCAQVDGRASWLLPLGALFRRRARDGQEPASPSGGG